VSGFAKATSAVKDSRSIPRARAYAAASQLPSLPYLLRNAVAHGIVPGGGAATRTTKTLLLALAPRNGPPRDHAVDASHEEHGDRAKKGKTTKTCRRERADEAAEHEAAHDGDE
jgi:hypothetical protein